MTRRDLFKMLIGVALASRVPAAKDYQGNTLPRLYKIKYVYSASMNDWTGAYHADDLWSINDATL